MPMGGWVLSVRSQRKSHRGLLGLLIRGEVRGVGVLCYV